MIVKDLEMRVDKMRVDEIGIRQYENKPHTAKSVCKQITVIMYESNMSRFFKFTFCFAFLLLIHTIHTMRKIRRPTPHRGTATYSRMSLGPPVQ